jgi:hypothetical protein
VYRAARGLGRSHRRTEVVHVVDPEAQMGHAEAIHRPPHPVALRLGLEPVEQLEAHVVAGQHAGPEPAVDLHRRRHLGAQLHREQLAEAEHVAVEAGGAIEVGAAHPDVGEPQQAHGPAT